MTKQLNQVIVMKMDMTHEAKKEENGKKSVIPYTTIVHDVRDFLGISLEEYCVANAVYHLSNNPDSQIQGWCYSSKKYIASFIRISDRTVFRCIEKLIKKDLVFRDEATKYLKTTRKWYETAVIQSNRYLYDKMTEPMTECHTDCDKMADRPYDKMADNNNIYNNNKYNYNTEDLKLANLLADLIEENNVKAWKRPTGSQIEAWADSVEKLHRIDGVDYPSIEMIIRWCQQDSFWKANILSTAKLRKQFPTLFAQAKRHAQKVLTPSI
jgi:hypothetical protein